MFSLDFNSLFSIIDFESLETKTVQLVKLKVQEIKHHIFFLLTQFIGNRTLNCVVQFRGNCDCYFKSASHYALS